MELLTISIAAGETKRFERAGRYLEIIDASYAVNIVLYDANGGQSDRALNALSGLYLEGAYSAIELSNGSTAQSVTLLITDGRGGSRRQPGNVRVIDQGSDKTLLGKQFHGSNTAPADPANYSVVNLQANGARVAVKALAVQSDVAGDVLLGRGSSAGTATALGAGGAANKYMAGAAPTHRIGVGITAGTTPTVGELPGWLSTERIFVPANTLVQVPLTTPLIVDGSWVLVLHGQAINRKVSWVLDIEEL